ncbi:MAG: M6 family metalloprotease domain-containing protein [Candidatus Odinarchaeota archaeon]
MSNRKFFGIFGISLVLILFINTSGVIFLNKGNDGNWMASQYPENPERENVDGLLTINDVKESLLDFEEGMIDGPFEFMIPEDPTVQAPRPKTVSRVPIVPQTRKTTGTIKIAVLLVYFKGGNYPSSHGPSYYQNLLFNHSNPKSVASYYWENSYGQLNITGEILGNTWYRSANNATYWGDDLGTVFPNVDNKNDKIYNLVAEGVQLADPTVNFTRFDTDKDGVVDHLLVIHAGNAQESAGGTVTDIWSHRWSVPFSCLVDGVAIKDYTMCAETSPMGTFGHELGHDIGDLPDLYDTDYSSDGIGDWGMMASGSWNYNAGGGEQPGNTPAHFCAWSKIKMGWITPTIVTTDLSSVTLPAIETNPQESVLKIYLSNDTHGVVLKEYLLVCYRQQTGFDSFIPGQGILIWHIDECVDGGNDNENRKLVDLEEADGFADPSGIPWEQLDYNNLTGPLPQGVILPDDEGNATDPWLAGTFFDETTMPNSDSNDRLQSKISITIVSANAVTVKVSHDPFPWDYTLYLVNKSAINFIDDEPSLIEHGTGRWGISQDFTVTWQSNRSGNWDIYGSQTNDAGKTWSSAVNITNSSSADYSPSLALWYPPAYWAFAYAVDKENKPISGTELRSKIQPPPRYVVAFVSERDGDPEIYITESSDFVSWSTPIQVTSDPDHDLDPCLITTPGGKMGLFWSSNRSGNYEIYFNEDPWNKTTVTRVTSNSLDERNPSYYFSRNGTHLLVFEREQGGNSSIHLLSTFSLGSWPTATVVCSDPTFNSTEPSLFEREDRTLLIAFTRFSGAGEEIHEVISSDWTHWSPHLVMGFPKNASNPSLLEARCGALFMVYATYNATQLPHVYFVHSTLCYRFGVGIDYPQDMGTSFFNPVPVEQDSDWIFTGYLHLNQSDISSPATDPLRLDVTDTKNTWDPNDDEPVLDDVPLDDPGLFPEIVLDPDTGTGFFRIHLPALQALPGELPTCTILRLRIKWPYESVKGFTNVNSSIYIELLPPQEQVRFEGNIPEQTTLGYPLAIQAPIIRGFVDYGVESVTLELKDTANGDVYARQTLVLTEAAKATGTWIAYLPALKDTTITQVVATSNGIYPRKEAILYINKLPWDTTPPQLTHVEPAGLQAEDFPIIFAETILDDLGIYDYGVDESTITFSYKIASHQNYWTDISYSASDSNWVKSGSTYQYTLNPDSLTKPVYIEYYWSASDLANPKNRGSEGSREVPRVVGIFPLETTTVYVTNFTTTMVYVTTCPPESTTAQTSAGFELLAVLGSLSLVVVVLRKKKK